MLLSIVRYLLFCTLLLSFESVCAEYQVTFDTPTENRGVKNQSLTMLLPVPRHLIPLNAEFSLVAEGKDVPAQYSILNIWPTNIDKQYIRLLSIEINNVLLPSNTVVLKWSIQEAFKQTLKKIKRNNYNTQQVKSNSLANFYIKNIDSNGLFILRKQFEPKFLMPKGLVYRYLLSGDIKAKQTLKKIFERSLDWDEVYSLRRGFWTERNQAAALNVAVSYWEIAHDERAFERINEIINATVAMTFNPENDWPLRSCPQHSFKSHEGWGDDSPTCSPWMMALLGDALWRFYQLMGDKRAASLIDTFGDFVLNYGIYYGDKRVNNIIIPKYIVSMENSEQEELNQWSDPQHACDVAALLGKSAYIKQQNNQDNFLVKALFRSLLEQCQQPYARLKKEQKKKRVKSYWSLKPPRRFGWMYSTTSDLPWLKNLLLNDY